MRLRDIAATGVAYLRARRLDALREPQALASAQAHGLSQLLGYVAERSPFYRGFAGRALPEWPVVSKREWMENFDAINTVGARLAELEPLALAAERTRDFTSAWRGHTVGLSTGTSGRRGLFLVSPAERAEWAGTLLGKLLREGPFARERIALVLRAGSTLYESVDLLRLRFQWFDQARPWDEIRDALASFAPTILVAPAQHLARLAIERAPLRPRRVISVAEVLDTLDRTRIEAAFGARVEQIYQATEGFLGASCEHGTVHLNEPYLHVEKEWLDAERTRFVPIVTDLHRRTQPVIRYRLDDVLRIARKPCPCGRPTTALDAIEGRRDDVLWLDRAGAAIPVFPDLVTRAIVNTIGRIDDYAVLERARGQWRVRLRPLPTEGERAALAAELAAVAARLGADPPAVDFEALHTEISGAAKRRRVRGLGAAACAS